MTPSLTPRCLSLMVFFALSFPLALMAQINFQTPNEVKLDSKGVLIGVAPRGQDLEVETRSSAGNSFGKVRVKATPDGTWRVALNDFNITDMIGVKSFVYKQGSASPEDNITFDIHPPGFPYDLIRTPDHMDVLPPGTVVLGGECNRDAIKILIVKMGVTGPFATGTSFCDSNAREWSYPTAPLTRGTYRVFVDEEITLPEHGTSIAFTIQEPMATPPPLSITTPSPIGAQATVVDTSIVTIQGTCGTMSDPCDMVLLKRGNNAPQSVGQNTYNWSYTLGTDLPPGQPIQFSLQGQRAGQESILNFSLIYDDGVNIDGFFNNPIEGVGLPAKDPVLFDINLDDSRRYDIRIFSVDPNTLERIKDIKQWLDQPGTNNMRTYAFANEPGVYQLEVTPRDDASAQRSIHFSLYTPLTYTVDDLTISGTVTYDAPNMIIHMDLSNPFDIESLPLFKQAFVNSDGSWSITLSKAEVEMMNEGQYQLLINANVNNFILHFDESTYDLEHPDESCTGEDCDKEDPTPMNPSPQQAPPLDRSMCATSPLGSSSPRMPWLFLLLMMLSAPYARRHRP